MTDAAETMGETAKEGGDTIEEAVREMALGKGKKRRRKKAAEAVA